MQYHMHQEFVAKGVQSFMPTTSIESLLIPLSRSNLHNLLQVHNDILVSLQKISDFTCRGKIGLTSRQ